MKHCNGSSDGNSRILEELSNDSYLRLPDVVRIVGVSRATIWRMIQASIFPKAHNLSVRTIGWRVGDIREYLRRVEEDAIPKSTPIGVLKARRWERGAIAEKMDLGKERPEDHPPVTASLGEMVSPSVQPQGGRS